MALSAVGAADRSFFTALDRPVRLSPDDEKKVEDLKKRDAEVRRHEQAHLSAAGAYAKGASKYDYETGPDGRKYAVGGEVDIDTAPIRDDPAAAIRKAQTIKRAALAPEDPSPQDRKVASEADAMERAAQKELAQARTKTRRGYSSDGSLVSAAGQTSDPALDLVG